MHLILNNNFQNNYFKNINVIYVLFIIFIYLKSYYENKNHFFKCVFFSSCFNYF